MQARYGPPTVLRMCSRLTVLGARPNTLAIILKRMAVGQAQAQVSRSSALNVSIVSCGHGNTLAHQGR